MKKCIRCGQVKEFTEFHKNPRTKDKLQGKCKICHIEISTQWSIANPERHMLSLARCRARKAGLEFSITVEDIQIPSHCPLLGVKLSAWGIGDRNTSPSLDRRDSTKGYTPDNIWIISFKANLIKNCATYEEFQLMANNWKDFEEIRCNKTLDMFEGMV